MSEITRKFKCGCPVPGECKEHKEELEEIISINDAAKKYSMPAATIRTALDRNLLTKIGLPISLYVAEIEALIKNNQIGIGEKAKKMKEIKEGIEN